MIGIAIVLIALIVMIAVLIIHANNKVLEFSEMGELLGVFFEMRGGGS